MEATDILNTVAASVEADNVVAEQFNEGMNMDNVDLCDSAIPVESTQVSDVNNYQPSLDALTSNVENVTANVDEYKYADSNVSESNVLDDVTPAENIEVTDDNDHQSSDIAPINDQQISSHLSESPTPSMPSAPSSPIPDIFDPTVDACVTEEESLSRTSRKKLTLPYFQLPKPELEEYLLSTDELLCGSKRNSSVSVADEHTPILPSKKSVLGESLADSKSSNAVTRTFFSGEYSRAIARIKELDESKSPGIQRLALREYLIQNINKKKSAAFNRSKEMSNLDENEEIGSMYGERDVVEERENSESSDGEEDEMSNLNENEEIGSMYGEKDAVEEREDSESSDGEEEEPTVSLSVGKHESNGIENVNNNSSEGMGNGNVSLEDEGKGYTRGVETGEKSYFLVKRKSKTKGEDSESSDWEGPTVSFSVEEPENKSIKIVNNNSDDGMGKRNRYTLSDVETDEESFFLTVKRRKPKTVKILEEDSSDSSLISLINSDFVTKMQEEDSSDSSLITSDIRKTFSYKEQEIFNSDENNGFPSFCDGLMSDTQLNMGFSDIPSYQPVAEFEENGNSCSVESVEDIMPEFFAKNSSSERNSPVPILSMDDPPLMLTGNASVVGDIFSSQDLASLCSGSFKKNEEATEPMFACEGENNETEDEYIKERNFQYEMGDSHEDPPVEKGINDFLDLEAELSGEDDGDRDDDDAESDAEGVDNLIADEDLPSNAQVREEIADLHLKHLMDDDEDILKEFKEKFLDDGELHNDGRTRRFAWKNSVDVDDKMDGISSESDDETPADSWSSMNQEKAKWLEENKEEVTENLDSSHKSLLKVNILGKPEFSQSVQSSVKRHSLKRPRGSFLHLDDSSASQVLKKLKTSEDVIDGSRTTKHFVFRNDEETNAIVKENPANLAPEDPIITSDTSNNGSGSIFTKI